MHYITIDNLKPGMRLSSEIYDVSGTTLLKANAAVTEKDIHFLNLLGILGVYINDDLTSNIIPESSLLHTSRKDAVTTIHTFFEHTNPIAPTQPTDDELQIKEVVTQVVNDILSQHDVMDSLVTIRQHDGYTFNHSADTAILAGSIAVSMHLPDKDIRDVVTAGFLHDIGKIFIAPNILNAPRKLTNEERIKMSAHPRLGYNYLKKNFHFNGNILDAVLTHHEWFNGMGYPDHRVQTEIPFLGRLLKCADVYDAMTAKRSYKDPYLPGDVLEYLMARSKSEFDPAIIQHMSKHFYVYPTGCDVQLSNGDQAIVIKNNPGAVLRPTVYTIKDKHRIDLMHNRNALNLTITKLYI